MDVPVASRAEGLVLRAYGWREWVALPDLGVPAIKAKLDTGARTSALHAERIQRFTERGEPWVRFVVHPLQGTVRPEFECTAPLVDHRKVTNSGGASELRLVISSCLEIGGESWPIEVTLTSRRSMIFRMLLGRSAIAGKGFVDPAHSFACGSELRRSYGSIPGRPHW